MYRRETPSILAALLKIPALPCAGLILFGLLALQPPRAAAASAVFGGGPFYSGGTAVMNTLRSSGFTTIILWCIHVDSGNGNLIYNDQLIVANGTYVGNSSWPAQLATLKTPPTSVNRIEVSVGSWGVDDFGASRTLMNNYGTNTSSILYRNFAALKTATGADAVDFDDETLYDTASTVKFGQMLAGMGYKVTLCPYTYSSFWQSVYNQLGNGIVDIVYLQCYAGGAGNNPASWNSYFGGLKVSPGMWCANGAGCASGNDPASVAAQMASWKSSAGIPGGFMWLYDDMLSCSSRGTPGDYANAINQAFESLQISPSVGFTAVAAYKNKYLPAGTPYILSNTASSTLNWSLASTSTWLNISATNGSLGNHGSATVAINLNPTVATNLPPSQYSATVWFTNITSNTRWPRTFTLNTAITNWPLTFSGCNAAVLAPRNATLSSPGATAFDIKNNYSFYEAGLNGSARGLPLNSTFVSLCQNGTAFQLRPYSSTNALMLGYNYPQSGMLALNPPQGFNSLAVLASSANGGGQGTLMLNFTNGTPSPVLRFNAQDWFNTTTNVALQGFGRLNLGNFNIEDNGDLNPNLYQTTFDLVALGLTQPISSITFSSPPGAGAQQNTAVFALSGMPAMMFPPAGLRATPRTNGTILLMWSSSLGATNYYVKRSTVAGGPYTLIGAARGSSYLDSGLADGTTYCYVVSADGPSGESDNSGEVQAKPCSYEAWILSAGPAAYWPLSETNGSTAFDLVAAHHGLHAGGYTLGIAGPSGSGFDLPHPAAHYNGSDASTQLPLGIGSTNFTIVLWIQTTDTGGTPSWTNGKGLLDAEVAGMTNDFGLALVGAKAALGVGNPDTTLLSSKSINDGVWHQIIATRDAGIGAMQIYIDGFFDAVMTGPAGARAAAPNLRLASLQTGLGFLLGNLSEVAVYNRVLTPDEISNLYRAAAGLFYHVKLTPQRIGSYLFLSWPGTGKLLEATNLSGPWTTNTRGSPVLVTPSASRKFYRVQMQ